MRFFVGVDAIYRCDFFRKKRCDAITMRLRCDFDAIAIPVFETICVLKNLDGFDPILNLLFTSNSVNFVDLGQEYLLP